MARLGAIWRHPVKGIGAEPLTQTDLSPNHPLPGDRAWAILTGSAIDTGEWQSCRNFARGCYGPELMAVTAKTDGASIRLSHPKLSDITIDPTQNGQDLVHWVSQIYPAERPVPAKLVKAPPEGMADAPFPSVSILGRASLDALSEACGQPMDMRRFRGNLWLDGLEPFEELSWVGQVLQCGDAQLRIDERIDRCRATEANPDTGKRDADTLRVLRKNWGHIDFGVKAVVIKGGRIALDDKVILL